MFSASKAGAPSGGYSISRSVRTRKSASGYFNRTFTTPTNNKIFTLSSWVKRGSDAGVQSEFFTAGTSGSNYVTCQFDAGNKFAIISETPSLVLELRTTQLFRDFSAWYHIVLSVDTTQATAANRVKVYVNGTQITSFSTSTYPAQNTNLLINSAIAHYFSYNLSGGGYFDGYNTESNFIDGQALTPSSFGVINSYGVWSPIKYSGTYGTNGFYLNFSDNSAATAAAIGKDSSGNGNNWTPNNISLTAGVTYDSMIDSPTTGSGSSNYCVLNPLFTDQIGVAFGYVGPVPTISNANLTATAEASSIQASAVCTVGVSTGKWYFEYTPSATNVSGDIVGFVSAFSGGITTAVAGYRSNGVIYTNGSLTGGYATWTAGDVIGIALSIDGSTISAYKNNALQATLSLTTAITNNCFPIIWFRNDAGAGSFNFGQRPFSYTPPTGFISLNTYNLPTPTISNGASYMAATTYTGTGASLAISNTVNSVSFQPDFVWVKGRSGATDHALYDSVRGTTKDLVSNSTAAETTQATGLTAFGTGGFTVGALAKMNTSSATYVGWQWKAGATSASNTNGSITSTVSAGAAQGFSVVTYTGTGANATVGHGLGVAPSMLIVKSKSNGGASYGWNVYHIATGNTGITQLNNVNAFYANSVYWNNTSPTSSVFSLGTAAEGNGSGSTYVAYCFAPIAGYSAFGSYTGNGSNDGPFVYLGFRPRFLLIKNSTTAGTNWEIWDTSRDVSNVLTNRLFPDSSSAESGGQNAYDFLSNGFKSRQAGSTDSNQSGATIIYMAFAENPFKYSLAR